MRRRGFSVAEILVVVAVTATLIATLMTLWTSSHKYSVQLEERFSLLARAQNALHALAREVQFGRRIAYPAPGGTEASLAVLDDRGALVQYTLEPGSGGRPGWLGRRVLGSPGNPTVLMAGVLDARFRVPPVPRGRDVDLVHITLTLAGPGGKPVHLIASARMRAPAVACPVER